MNQIMAKMDKEAGDFNLMVAEIILVVKIITINKVEITRITKITRKANDNMDNKLKIHKITINFLRQLILMMTHGLLFT